MLHGQLLLAVAALSFPGGDGWTAFTASPDTRIVYVSSSLGNDAGGESYAPSDPEIGPDPFNPVGPVQRFATLSAAKGQLRSGMPDWMLLLRGDTWYESLGLWAKSGRSAEEPMLVGSYGTAPQRPTLLTGSGYALQTFSNQSTPVNHLALAGLSFRPHTRQPDQSPTGLHWLAPTDGLLVEDCHFSEYAFNIAFDRYPEGSLIRNVRIRRCVIVDSWNVDSIGHSQGLYADDTDGILIEENVFDHNGWKAGISGAGPTIYNHNVYLQNGARNAVLRGNIVSDGANHGVQVRRGGVVDGNLFTRNVVGLLLGGGDSPTPGGVNATAVGNVLLEGKSGASFPAGFGIDLKNVAGGLVEGNILAGKLSTSDAFAIGSYVSGGPAGVGVNNMQIRDNLVYDWRGAVQLSSSTCSGVVVSGNVLQDPQTATTAALMNTYTVSPGAISFSGNTYHSARPLSQWFQVGGVLHSLAWWQGNAEAGAVHELLAYPDPGRTTGSYAATLGLPATHQAFIDEARLQGRHNWRLQYTAAAVNEFVRAGYGLASPGCPFDCDTAADGAVGIADLLALLDQWDSPGSCASGGVVGEQDLLDLLASWGPCPW